MGRTKQNSKNQKKSGRSKGNAQGGTSIQPPRRPPPTSSSSSSPRRSAPSASQTRLFKNRNQVSHISPTLSSRLSGYASSALTTMSATLNAVVSPLFATTAGTAPRKFTRKAPAPGVPWHLEGVSESWASCKNADFPNSANNREAAMAKGGLCPVHDFGFDDTCNCVAKPGVQLRSRHWEVFTPEIMNNLELYKDTADKVIKPLMREVLVNKLIAECGSEAAFRAKYRGWADTLETYPDVFRARYKAFQDELYEYCFELKRLPICVFHLTGDYNTDVFPTGRFKNGTDFSTAARLDRSEKRAKESREQEIKREEFEDLCCGPNCPCNGGSSATCKCTLYNLNKSGLRAYFDEHGTFRMGNGLTTLGVDGVPTELTEAEKANVTLVGCTEKCGCGDGCRQKQLSKGCRFLELINVDPVIGMEIRAGEDTLRGEIGSIMTGKWILQEEKESYDKRMFLKDMSPNWSYLFTADDWKNDFYIYGHQCEPSMTTVKCYIDRDADFPRPLAISRCALKAGDRKAWHYANGQGPPEFPCVCGSPKCWNPAPPKIVKKIIAARKRSNGKK